MAAIPGIYGYFGISGSGKSHAMRQDILTAYKRGDRILILDIAEEWNTAPRGVNARRYQSIGLAVQNLDTGNIRLAIVQDFDIDSDQAELAATWAIESEGSLAIPEAHNVYPAEKRRPSKSLDKLITAWRHRRAALYWDSQRISRMNRTVVEQTTALHMFAVVGDRDLDVVAGINRELPSYALEAAIKLQQGEPGYHVALGLSRLPPYRLVRK